LPHARHELASRLRPRAREAAERREPGVLRPVRARPHRLGAAKGRGGRPRAGHGPCRAARAPGRTRARAPARDLARGRAGCGPRSRAAPRSGVPRGDRGRVPSLLPGLPRRVGGRRPEPAPAPALRRGRAGAPQRARAPRGLGAGAPRTGGRGERVSPERILVVGSVALDTIRTPYGAATEALGGSASYFSFSASHFAPVSVVAVVGQDFPAVHRETFARRDIDLAGLEAAPGRTFRWRGEYMAELGHAHTLET